MSAGLRIGRVLLVTSRKPFSPQARTSIPFSRRISRSASAGPPSAVVAST